MYVITFEYIYIIQTTIKSTHNGVRSTNGLYNIYTFKLHAKKERKHSLVCVYIYIYNKEEVPIILYILDE
jgi:hypothetical protein